MTTLTLDAALRQQALTQLGIAKVLTMPDVTPTDLVLMAQATQDPELLTQIQQVAESQAHNFIKRYNMPPVSPLIVAVSSSKHN